LTLLDIVVVVCSCYIFSSFIGQDIIKTCSREIDKLLSMEKKTRKNLPLLKTTQRTAISNDVPRPPPLFSCCTTTRPDYEERLLQEKHTMPNHRCPYPECEYKTGDVKDELVAALVTVHSNGTNAKNPLVNPLHSNNS